MKLSYFVIILVFIITYVLYLNNQYLFSSHDSFSKNNQYTSLVVIHASSPTKAQIKRYLEWNKAKLPNYYVMIVTDKCELRNNITTIPISCLTPDEFMSQLPVLKTMTGLCTDKWPGWYMWTSCIEHTIMGIRHIDVDFKYMWMVEQDIAYTGNFFDFFKKYDEFDDDFITQPYTKQYSNVTWMWFDCSTPQYTAWKESKHLYLRWSGQINIARLSVKLIQYVEDNIKNKKHTFSEATLIETTILNGLKHRIIDKNDFGEICSVFDRISIDQWMEIQSNQAKRNKLYHALKF